MCCEVMPIYIIHVFQPEPIDVQVVGHQMQRYAVWFGGSMFASTVSSEYMQTKKKSVGWRFDRWFRW